MNQTAQEFKHMQDKAINTLKSLLEFIVAGEELGVQIDQGVKEKLENAIKTKQNEKLKVALVGGFSQGKTSIAAAWLGELKDGMNISQAESSDAVAIYDVGDIEIVDTPGLYGFKEKLVNASNNEIQKYKDITKKYVSQANLLLYVMNPTNPIKQSQEEDIKWLFRDLGLLSRTIFVLGRFDEVADVEDEKEYEDMLKLKQNDVLNRLDDCLSLSPDEKNTISIVAVCANPFDRGMEYYLQNMEEFKRLSHIHTLQDKTTEKIRQSGGTDVILLQTKTSIIKDILQVQIPKAKEVYELVEKNVEELKGLMQDKESELGVIRQSINSAKNSLRTFTANYFSDLVIMLRGTSIETFGDFVEMNIGNEGINIQTQIQNTFEAELSSINIAINKIETNYKADLDSFGDFVSGLGKQGIDILSKSGAINAENIKLARDGIVGVAKFFNIDLALKFKPWGAIKLASNLNKALPIISMGFELWDSYNAHQREKKFQEAKADMEQKLHKQQKELIDFINSDEFTAQCFANFIALENSINKINEELLKSEEKRKAFEEWRKRGDVIEAEIIS